MNKKIICCGMLLFAYFLLFSVYFYNETNHRNLNNKITGLINHFDKNLNIGMLVIDAKTGAILIDKNSDRYFMPASNEKLFTGFAALDYLGADFTYKTQLFIDNVPVKNEKLDGNIYLQFSGDPTLTASKLDHLIHTLAELSIHEISGNIVLDDSAFDQQIMSPGTAWDDKDYCWGAPINAIILNRNCVTATLTPASEAGQLATLVPTTFPQTMHFINQIVTQSAETKNCQVDASYVDKQTYSLQGCITQSTAVEKVSMALKNPREAARLLLPYLLNKNHIVFHGKILFSRIPIQQTLVAYQTSVPVSQLVNTMLKESDNLIANTLFKTIGARYTHTAGSFANGNHALRSILSHSLHLKMPKKILVDGTGLSRYNFITPRQLVDLLQKVQQSAQSVNFIAALPILGIDGTLKTRLNDPRYQGKILAKTGSETAVTTLAGYLQTTDNRKLIFAIMMNNFIESPEKYKLLEDALCAELISFN